MTEQSSAWQRLLLSHCNWKPTLPFIIGALREHAEGWNQDGDDLQEVVDLLHDMASTPIPGKPKARIFVQLCSQLQVPVFSIANAPYNLNCAAQFGLASDNRIRLCFSREIEQSANASLDDIADRLLYGYGHAKALELRHYSRDPDAATWRNFDEADHKRIISALQLDLGRGQI